jgi:agmatine/peptidylarginine deiminase
VGHNKWKESLRQTCDEIDTGWNGMEIDWMGWDVSNCEWPTVAAAAAAVTEEGLSTVASFNKILYLDQQQQQQHKVRSRKMARNTTTSISKMSHVNNDSSTDASTFDATIAKKIGTE